MSEVTPEMIEAFKRAWHEADAQGLSGQRVSAGLEAALADLVDELERLRRWKAEVLEILPIWDQVHEALGSPARLGEDIAEASLRAALELNETDLVSPTVDKLKLTEAQEWWLHWIDEHPGQLHVYWNEQKGRNRWQSGIQGMPPRALEALLSLGLIKLGPPVQRWHGRQTVTLTAAGRRRLK